MYLSKRYLLDTNVLIRFLTGDPPSHAAAAHRLFARAEAGETILEVSPVIVAEAYDTMISFYKSERRETAFKLRHLLRKRGVQLDEADRVLDALARLETTNVAFADAFLAATAYRNSTPVASFDRDFDQFKGITRYEPAP